MPIGTIRQHRDWKGGTQKEAAKAIGCSVNGFFNYENGLAEISFAKIVKFANWVGCNVSDIIVPVIVKKESKQPLENKVDD